MFKLPQINFDQLSGTELLSEETIEFHVFQHHQGYINKLNEIVKLDDSLKNRTLIEIINTTSNDATFNNAAQTWNHTFFWNSISTSKEQQKISKNFDEEIKKYFKNKEDFQLEFKKMALGNFGSGWTWLVKNLENSKLEIINTSNAMPVFKLSKTFIPLLVCDVWEHAYYIDYRNKRNAYVDQFLVNINWRWAEKCFNENKVQDF